MLVKCPKCNFSQPKDQYCAQCGIDMTAYQIETPSFFSRMIASKAFLVFIIFALTLAAGTYISKNAASQKLVEKLTSYNLASSNQVEITSPPTSARSTDEATATTNESASTENSDDTNLSPQTTGETETAATASAEVSLITDPRPSDQPAANAASANRSRTLRIYYTSVDTAFLARIFTESQNTNQFANFGAYSAGVIPELSQKLTPSNTQIKILHQLERKVEERRNVTWFVGRNNPDDPTSNLGFSTTFELREYDSQAIRGAVSITRYWKDLNRFPAEIEMNYQSGFFISGLMPNHLPAGSPESFLEQAPFQILKDPAFRAKKSEFVIFIEVDSN